MFPAAIFDYITDTILLTLLAFFICLPFLFKSKDLKAWKQYIITRIEIHSFLKEQKRKIKVYMEDLKRIDLSAVDLGIVPSTVEYELENPSKELCAHSDGIHFVGISSDENLIDICINKIEENMALVWVVLKLSNGSIYKLPSTDSRKFYVANENMFSSSGLQIKCLSPLRKWRISFNGLLEKHHSMDETNNELIHTKFSFVWLAMSAAQEQNFSYSEKELTDAFIKENHNIGKQNLICLQELQSRYEQWGQMMGTITFSGEDEKDFYFWSIRTRIIDSPAWNEDMSCVKFYMYFMDGVPLKVESIFIKDFVSNLTSGFTINPNGAVKYISNCTFNIHLLTETDKEIEFSFILNGEKKRIYVCFMGDNTTFYTGPELQFQVILKPFKVQMNDCDEGFGILHYSVKSTIEQKKSFQCPPLLLKDLGYSSCEKSVLLLDDEICSSSLIAGGKGSSLALLTQLAKQTKEFIVPKGFVITTKAFKDHLNINKDVFDCIQRLKDVACKQISGDLKTECNKCTTTFVSSQLSEYLKNEVKHTLLDNYESLENIRFSVRSSAYGEDSEDLSAAGQMLTVLGVRRMNNIFEAIMQCWSSKFSFEAVQYARQNGQSLLSPMAVVVQEMVPSDYSGVMFTVEPVTGDPSYPLITANFGLGETVVSALAEPDTIVLKRKKDLSICVFETKVGTKETQVFMRVGDGVQKNYENKSEKLCLTNEWALKIGRAGILIESCFCSPRDIEWAVHKDQLYLLQARPITTLHKETDFELIHDQDTPVRSIHDFWTRANIGEVFLGATSPLGISLVVCGMDYYNHKMYVMREKRYSEYCPYFFHILPVTHKQIAMNVVDTLFKANEKEITPVQKAFEAALFGRAVITEEIHKAGIKKYGYASKKQKYLGIIFVPMLSYTIPRTIAKIDKEISNYELPLESYTSAKKTWDGILSQMNFYSEVAGVHGRVTFLSSYFNMMLMTILSKGKREWDTELYCDFATMLSSCSGIESADVPESLQELAKMIALNHSTTFLSLPVNDAYDLLKNDTGVSGKLFEKFIQQHGHRCVKEFDIYSKSWGMQPETLMPTLQNMVRVSSDLNIATKEVLTTEDIISKIKTPLSNLNKRILQFLLPRSRKYVCQREKTKSMLIKTVNWLRKSCYHLGNLMVKEGMLPESELVFFLTPEEIQEILDSQKPGLVPKAMRRRRLHAELNELKLPEIMEGIPKPNQVQDDNSSYAASFTLKGTPVCQGKVKARAVVVLTLEQASEIKSGDILITHATDIGWSPYFPLLSGVVTVLGGLISHGAVIAREFGLPCIVGVENATTAFRSGDIVILNGTEGTVTKVLAEE